MNIYVDASIKNGTAGIGVVVKKGKDLFSQEFVLIGCHSSHDAETIAVYKGVELANQMKEPSNNIKIFTDCVNIVEKHGGLINGVKIEWIPRRLNLAHDYSVSARNVSSNAKSICRKKLKEIVKR